jgi:hypothetical protein
MTLANEPDSHDRTAIVLVYPDHQRALSVAEARRVLDRFDVVAREASKWRRSTGRGGRLLLIDLALVREIETLLNAEDAN